MPARTVHLATVIGEYAGVLPHMLEHYRSLGITSFFVNLNLRREDDPFREQAEQIVRAFGGEIHLVRVGRFRAETNAQILRAVRGRYPDDWFVLADQDELQVYPADLGEVIEMCERRGFDYVEGCFLDRIAGDGGFPAVAAEPDIWQQFPAAGFLSYPLLNAYPRKIVLARGRVQVGPGQHIAGSGRGVPTDDVLVQVHHFKWVAGVRERLEARARTRDGNGDPFGDESWRFVSYYDANGGRIRLDDERFMIADCRSRPYPHWDKIKEIYKTL